MGSRRRPTFNISPDNVQDPKERHGSISTNTQTGTNNSFSFFSIKISFPWFQEHQNHQLRRALLQESHKVYILVVIIPNSIIFRFVFFI